MTFKTIGRISVLGILAFWVGPACSSSSIQGTDSNTHWISCTTVADCPTDGGVFDCKGGRCVDVSHLDAGGTGGSGTGGSGGTGSMGGPCPSDARSSAPCDGRVAQCWTACAQGFKEQLVCSDGAWLAGHGLFPCGPDASTPPPDGGSGTHHDAATVPDAGHAPDAGGISTACQRNSDCALVNATCCGTCGEPGASDKAAVSRTSVSAWVDARCAGSGACPPCIARDGTFVAVCDAGRCTVQNLAQSMECLKDSDCAIRAKDCCACGTLGRDAFAAMNASAGWPACTAACAACPGGLHAPSDLQVHCNVSGGYCELY
jgi:hypothetical protein